MDGVRERGRREVADIEENDTKENKEDEEDDENKTPFLKLFSYADFYDYILMGIGSLAACVNGASIPVFFIFFGKIINIIGANDLSSSPPHKITKYSLDLVYLGIVVMFSSWMEVACWMHTGERQATKMRMAYLKSMINHDIEFFDTEASTGEVIAAMTSDILVVQDTISQKVGNFLHYTSRFITGFTIGFIHVWQISFVTLCIVPLIAIAAGIYAYVATSLMAGVRKSYTKANEIAREVIANVRIVQAFVGEERSIKSYMNALQNTYVYGKRVGLAKGLGIGSTFCVLFLSWALLVWFTSIVVHKGIANGGESFTTMFNVFVAGMSLGLAAPNLHAFIRARVAAYPIFQMLERNSAGKATCESGETLTKVDGHIEFKDVCFSYPSRPDVEVFHGLCLDIAPGKVVALVGGSGSGKSTIISLIERFYEPSSGHILLDGHHIKHLQTRWLRHQIGLVTQEPALFAATIRDNLLYGKCDATLDDIAHATKLSDAFSFINNLPDGFETQVGEHGIQLSGGQKQRIAIARAILKDPSILLLDEATSALDAESEKKVQEALEKAMVGRTTVVVAHRLSTIRRADAIVMIQGGKVLESGTHEQLTAHPSSIYASLLMHQEAAAASSSSQCLQRSDDSTGSRALSIESSRQLSGAMQGFGASFHSDKESCMSKESDIEKPKHVSLWRLYSMAAQDWLYGLLGAIGAIAAGALLPFFALGISQTLVTFYMDWDTTRNEVKKISILFIVSGFLAVISHTIEHLYFGIMGEGLTLGVREKMFKGILNNEIGFFDNANNTSVMLSSSLEADAALLKTIVVDRSITLLQNISLTGTSLIIAFMLNWRMTLVVLATYPLLISGQASEILFMQGYGVNLNKAYMRANMHVGEAVSNIRTIAAFCLEANVVDLYARELEEPSRQSFQRGQIAGIFYGIAQCCVFCSYALALWYGSVLVGQGLLSFKSMVKSFVVLMVSAAATGETLAMAPDLIKGTQMVESVFQVLDRKTKINGDSGEGMERVDGTIEFQGVRFCYPSRPDIIIFRDINLKVSARSTMALVGSSGSGKSSVLSLILRFYDPTTGRVTIDGKDIKMLKLKWLRKRIALVQQEPALFATTIMENILYGRDGATEAEVVEAAKAANAHSFISALPEGYSTTVGERGVQLSGGQKQRIAIARAVLKDPAILLLDEATSALDVESERAVLQALDRMMKDRTTILVAHRLSTIQNADFISVLQDGKIVEQGVHSALMQNTNGAYFKLIHLQQRHQQLLNW